MTLFEELSQEFEVGETTLAEISVKKEKAINDIAIISSDRFFCYVCKRIYKLGGEFRKKNSRINDHLKRKRHLKNLEAKDFFENATKTFADNFHDELCKAFIIENVPLEVLNENSKITKVLQKYTGRTVFSPTHYRNMVMQKIFEKQKKKNYQELKGKSFYLIVDGG